RTDRIFPIASLCPSRKFHPARGFASSGRIVASLRTMLAILHLLRSLLADLFKSRSRLEAENLFLRHQLNITLRRHYLGLDCAVAIGLCWSGWLECVPGGSIWLRW